MLYCLPDDVNIYWGNLDLRFFTEGLLLLLDYFLIFGQIALTISPSGEEDVLNAVFVHLDSK